MSRHRNRTRLQLLAARDALVLARAWDIICDWHNTVIAEGRRYWSDTSPQGNSAWRDRTGGWGKLDARYDALRESAAALSRLTQVGEALGSADPFVREAVFLALGE